jgi:SIR2-like domain
MIEDDLEPGQWRLVSERLASGQCVPFLGAAANVSGNGYRGLPLGDEVALHLVGKLLNTPLPSFRAVAKVRPRLSVLQGYKELTRLGAQDLARVALMLSGDQDDLFSALEEKLLERQCGPSPLLELLARMPGIKLIVTTNYDRLMEDALDAYERTYKVVIQPKQGFELTRHKALEQELWEYDGLVLYKLHGTLAKPEEIILTEEDYIEFLTIAASTERGVPKPIQEAFVESSLLFLGYGLQDWDFRTIYKALIEKLDREKSKSSWAIQHQPSRFWTKFWFKKDVEIFDIDLYRFVERLEREYERHSELLPKKAPRDE